MKISNKIAAALLALGIVSQASADPVVYLTGSTAFRSVVYNTLSNNGGTNNGGVFDAGTVTGVASATSQSGANYMVFHGNINGSGVYINCAWSGSEAGIASACNTTLQNKNRAGATIALAGSPEIWVNATNATVLAAMAYPIAGNTGISSLLESSSHAADLAMADTSQAVSWTPYVASTQTALKDYGSVGVVTFTWTRNIQNANGVVNANNSNEWVHCSNITLPQINTLLANGWVPAGFISGNPADNDFTVYVVGRNRGSGTRMNALATSTYGAHNIVQQYSIGYGVDGSDPAQSTSTLWLTNENNGGYESGGGVAKALGTLGGNTTGSCSQADPFHGGAGWFALGYISPADALNTSNGNGGEPTNNWVTVDGVLSSNGTIENGSWWYWGHEHVYGKYQVSGVQDTVGGLLYQAIPITMVNSGFGTNAVAHDAGIPYAQMTATKSSDVSFPLPF